LPVGTGGCWFDAPASERDQRPGKPCFGPVEEQPHAQGLGPLDSHQAHLPPDMVFIRKQGHLGLVVFGILLQPRNSIFNAAAESGADLKSIVGDAIGHHGNHLGAESLRLEIFS